MSTLDLSPNLKLPPEFMTLTSAALGLRGSGKTNTGVVCTEELLELQQQIIIIDPLDVWWGLKSSEDGKAPGYPIVVLGGTHADLPMTAHDGVAVADFLVESRTPAILSLRHFKSKGDTRKFVADFAEQFYVRKGEPGLNTPVLIVIDEASLFVPQNVLGDLARCVGAIESLVRQGRVSGIGVLLIDQRAASVNKNVLTQLEILFAHRSTSPQDRTALRDWIRANDTENREPLFMETLATLGRGEAWVWSPSPLNVFERVQVRKRRTFDSSATPAMGKTIIVPDVVAPIDLGPLRERLGQTLEESQKSDPKALKAANAKLRAENANLTRQMEERPVEERIVEVERVKVVQIPVLSPEARAQIGDQIDAMFAFGKDFMAVVQGVRESLQHFDEVTASRPVTAPEPPKPPLAPPKVEVPPAPPKSPPPPKENRPPAEFKLKDTQQRLLNVMVEWESLGVNVVSRSNLATWAGLKPNTGSFDAHIKVLKEAGLIFYPQGNHIGLTDEGREQAAPPQRIPNLEAFHEIWYRHFKDTQAAMLRVLVGHYPEYLSREELAEAVGLKAKTGSFDAHIKTLKDAGVLSYPEPGYVCATKLLFPQGLK